LDAQLLAHLSNTLLVAKHIDTLIGNVCLCHSQ